MRDTIMRPLLISDVFTTGTWYSWLSLNGDQLVLGWSIKAFQWRNILDVALVNMRDVKRGGCGEVR